MAQKQGRDYLYLIWKEPVSRRNYIIGELSKNGKYEFRYSYEINKAIDVGFKPLVSFPDIDKPYTSEVLFPSLASRLPDKKRADIDEILLKYKLSEYNEYQLLKNSGARVPYDNFLFIDPIFPSDEKITRIFYLSGPRHYIGCQGEDCNKVDFDIVKDEKVFLHPEPENEYDKQAIMVKNKNDKLLGYIPRYYCDSILKKIANGNDYQCSVLNFNNDNCCDECIKVSLCI